MKDQPLVSVAVITYNMERYLRTLLDSILKQKVNFRYEIVIDDDFSSDNSRKIIREYEEQYPDIIRPIYRNKNVGGSRNMYGVLRRCRGNYIAILEGDDYWEDETKLRYQLDFLESHSMYIGMTCNSWCDHGEKPEYKDIMRKRKEAMIFSFSDFQNRHFHDRLPTSTDTWVFHNIFMENPDEDFSILYKAHPMIWDQSLILILYGKGNVYADPKVVSHHRSIVKRGGTNYQSVISQKNMLYLDSKMYKRMEQYIKNHMKRECGRFYEARGEVWIDAFFRAVHSGERPDWIIAHRIWKEQADKRLLLRMLLEKTKGIVIRKLVQPISSFGGDL